MNHYKKWNPKKKKRANRSEIRNPMNEHEQRVEPSRKVEPKQEGGKARTGRINHKKKPRHVQGPPEYWCREFCKQKRTFATIF